MVLSIQSNIDKVFTPLVLDYHVHQVKWFSNCLWVSSDSRLLATMSQHTSKFPVHDILSKKPQDKKWFSSLNFEVQSVGFRDGTPTIPKQVFPAPFFWGGKFSTAMQQRIRIDCQISSCPTARRVCVPWTPKPGWSWNIFGKFGNFGRSHHGWWRFFLGADLATQQIHCRGWCRKTAKIWGPTRWTPTSCK